MRVDRKHLAVAAAVCGIGFPGLRAVADVVTTRLGPNGNTYRLLARANAGGGFDGVTWSAAEAEAVTLGGHLATINDAREDAWVFRTFSPYRSDFWIGLNAVASPGTFVWSSGQPVTYTNWAPGEPNPDPNARYVHQWWVYAGKWRAGFTGEDFAFGVAEIANPAGAFKWQSAGGGVFSNGTNWLPPGPPPAAGAAIFDLGGTYPVTFSAPATNAVATVEQGNVTFGLAGNTYSLTELYLGATTGKSASLTLTGTGLGKVQASHVTLGDAVGSSGSLTVPAGTSLAASTDLVVGNAGNGTFNVSAGGAVNTVRTYLGNWPGGTGSVVLSGIGAAMTGTDVAAVGWHGTGALQVASGAKLTAAGLEIAEWEDATGSAVLDGSASSIDSTAGVSVGLRGAGTLTVSGGAKLHAIISGSALGQWGTLSSGTAVVTGPGSSWLSDYGISVGGDGHGDLRVEAGGSVVAHDISIGAGVFSNGTVRVTGTGSHLGLIDVGGFAVGGDGTGTLTIDNQGDVSGTDIQIGAGPTGVGTVTVTGAGATLRPAGGIRVGAAGAGTLTVSGGAVVPMAWMELGGDANSYGAASFSGGGTSATIQSDLNVGASGTGVLAVSNGAHITVASWLRAGFQPGSNGQISISGPGASINASGQAIVGEQGTGMLTIDNGGHLDVGGDMHLGAGASASGQMKISGAGSALTIGGALRVAEAGPASVVVDGGAAVTASQGAILGDQPGAVGSLAISGTGSQMTTNGNTVQIGVAGQGTVTAAAGATISTGWVLLGSNATGTGAATVRDAGTTWTSSGSILVGDSGQGRLDILDGAKVYSHESRIGTETGSTGQANVAGTGSLWQVAGPFLAVGNGNGARGTLTVGAGGLVTINGELYTAYGTIHMAGGTVNATTFRFDFEQNSLDGYGTITGATFGHDASINANGGKLTLGDPGRTDGFGVQGIAYTVGNGATLEVLDADYAVFDGPGVVALNNGVLIGRNGLGFWGGNPTGYGVVVGPMDRPFSTPTGTVNMTQTLDVGPSGAHVYSIGVADLGTLTTMAGGQLIAPNGVRFGPDDVLSGYGTVVAGVVLDNGVITAAPGKTLTIAGSLSGRGVLVGNVNPFINSLDSSPSGVVTLSKPLDIGNQTARVYSQGAASLGPAVSLAGGSIIAANGLTIARGSALSGFGTVNADIQLTGGSLRQSGGGLIVNGRLSGYGLLYGTPSFTTVDPASATVVFDSPMNTGGGLLWLYSQGPAEIRSTLTLGQGGAGTDLGADNGILVTSTGTLAGYGKIQSPLTNAGGRITPSGAELAIASTLTQNSGSIDGLAIRFLAGGSFTGSGLIKADTFSDAGSTITATGPLELGNAASSTGVNLAGKLDAGTQTVTLHSAAPAVLAGQTLLAGGRLAAPGGMLNSGTLAGHGIIDAAGGFTNATFLTSSGVTDVFAPVVNAAAGKITVTGGGPTTFYNAIQNAGDIKISQASIAVFLGSVTGAGTFSGTGTKIFESGPSALAAVATPGNTIVQPAAVVSADVFRENALTVRGKVTINANGGPDGTSVLNILQIDPGGMLDLKNNDVVLLSQSPATYDTVRQWIRDGRLATTADSPSPLYPAALAPVDNHLLHAIAWNGLPISNGSVFDQLMVKYTYLGDVNLDGQVTDADLYNAIAHLGRPGTWFEGDVNLDGLVTLADFDVVRQHLGAGDPSLGGTPLFSSYTVVPEPGAIILLGVGVGLGLRRARRGPKAGR